MLVIRMQRTGRKGHAMFRVVVQDSRRTPTSGKVVASLGSYDPHAKTAVVDKDKAGFYLKNGAQPSGRVIRLLKDEGVKLPDWVNPPAKKERTIRNADKRRSTRPEAPPEPKAPAEETPAAEETATETAVAEETAPAEEAKTEEAAEEEPAAEEPASEEAAPEAEKTTEPAPEEPAAAEAEEKPVEDAEA
jgi:small subunit ribosomal protein S16